VRHQAAQYQRPSARTLETIHGEIEGILDACRKQNNRGLTHEEQADFDQLQEEFVNKQRSMDSNKHAISEFGGVEEMRDTFRMSPKQQRERADGPRGQAFDRYLRNGIGALSDADRALVTAGADPRIMNTTSTTTGSQGGYVVPQGFSDQLMAALKWFGGIDGVVGEFSTETGNPMPWPTINDTTNMGRMIGQNVQVVQTDPVFNSVTFNSYIFSSDIVLIPLALMEDSFFDLNALIARLLGTRIGRLLNQKCTIGTGTNEPTGILTAATTAGLTNVLGTGNTTAIAYNNLVDMEHLVDPAYRNRNARFMFSDGTLKTLKKLVDGNNRPLWQPGISASFQEGAAVIGESRPTILGYPYLINGDMPAPAANAKTIIFGDLSTYKLRKVGVPTVLRLVERYSDYLQVGFLGFFRGDGNLVDAGTHPLSLNIQSAT